MDNEKKVIITMNDITNNNVEFADDVILEKAFSTRASDAKIKWVDLDKELQSEYLKTRPKDIKPNVAAPKFVYEDEATTQTGRFNVGGCFSMVVANALSKLVIVYQDVYYRRSVAIENGATHKSADITDWAKKNPIVDIDVKMFARRERLPKQSAAETSAEYLKRLLSTGGHDAVNDYLESIGVLPGKSKK